MATKEKLDWEQMAEDIQSGKVVYAKGRSAATLTELDFLKDAADEPVGGENVREIQHLPFLSQAGEVSSPTTPTVPKQAPEGEPGEGIAGDLVTPQGTVDTRVTPGSETTDDLTNLSPSELKARAAALGVTVKTGDKKEEIIAAIRAAETGNRLAAEGTVLP